MLATKAIKIVMVTSGPAVSAHQILGSCEKFGMVGELPYETVEYVYLNAVLVVGSQPKKAVTHSPGLFKRNF
jgi:hypothetical protein